MSEVIQRSGATLAQIEATPEFKALKSPKQILFVQTYLQSLISIGTADPLYAVQVSFDVENGSESARTFAYHLLRAPRVRRVLDRYRNWGKSERELFAETVKSDMEAAKPGSAARARLVELYGSLAFGANISKSRKSSKSKLKRRKSNGKSKS